MSNEMSVEQVLAQMRAMRIEAQGGGAAKVEDKVDFGGMLKNSIDQVAANQQKAREMSTKFEMGQGDANLAEVMVAMQKSSVSFQAMVQVRNKLVEAYKEVMQMPV